MDVKVACLVGSLDTKGEEFLFLKERIEAQGVQTLVMDGGVMGEPAFAPDIPASETAKAAQTDLETLRSRGDRGEAVAAMADGAARLAADLFAEGKIDGVVSLGGSAGTTIGTAAMRALPFGAPKVMVSTLASGNVQPYVQTKDIAMIYPIVDVAGLNSVLRRSIANAAACICGMLNAPPLESSADRPVVAATMFGVTTPCVTAARAVLEEAGYETLVFHATGVGGQAMESLIRDGAVQGVLDITTTELADELVGGILSAGPDRLNAAAQAGVPQIAAPGALDMVNFGPPGEVPAEFAERIFYQHNPNVTLMRTTPDECRQLGETIARKLNASKAPAAFLFPQKGFSAIDAEGQPFENAEARAAFLDGFKSQAGANLELIELDAHINDAAFAEAAAKALLKRIEST